MEIGNLPNKQFKVLIIKIISKDKEFGRRMDQEYEKLEILNKEKI